MNIDRRTFLTGIAGLATGSIGVAREAKGQSSSTKSAGGRVNRFLFLDREHIDRMDGLEVLSHPAKRFAGNPLMVKKYPWEKSRLQLYGRSIVFNTERRLYQMYYLAQPNPSHFPNIRVGGITKVGFATLPAYAESSDGIHWERPLRKEVPFEDIAETNLLDMNLGQSFEPSVFFDAHDPDPNRRYKAFIWDQRFQLPVAGKLDYRRAAPSRAFPRGLLISMLIRDDAGNIVYEQPYNDYGIMVAFSADGIHWTKHPDWVIRCYSDTGQTALYDPRLGRYVAFGRFNQQQESPAFYIGRNIARVESADFLHWSEPELVLAGDDRDPDSLQINSMPIDLYEGLYLGVMELDVRPHPNPHRQIQLAVSRDGRRWTRVADRSPFLEDPSPGAWDEGDAGLYDRAGGKEATPPQGFIRPATGLFIHDDQVRMYYSNVNGRDPLGGIGMATWRRDGFVSLHAGDSGGELLTRAFVPTGPTLHLNVDASQGEATVRVCDFQGRLLTGWSIDQPSAPIRGDRLDAPIQWTDSDFSQRVGKATTLRIRLRNADLYSFWTD